MSSTFAHRPSPTVWMLYFSVLLGVLLCGLGHGQMQGLRLNGVGGTFCSLTEPNRPAPTPAVGGALDERFAVASFDCPLCASPGLVPVLPLALCWPRAASPLRGRQCDKVPPRHVWPSANPRASPAG